MTEHIITTRLTEAQVSQALTQAAETLDQMTAAVKELTAQRDTANRQVVSQSEAYVKLLAVWHDEHTSRLKAEQRLKSESAAHDVSAQRLNSAGSHVMTLTTEINELRQNLSEALNSLSGSREAYDNILRDWSHQKENLELVRTKLNTSRETVSRYQKETAEAKAEVLKVTGILAQKNQQLRELGDTLTNTRQDRDVAEAAATERGWTA